jgi:signal transduction histidine kinase
MLFMMKSTNSPENPRGLALMLNGWRWLTLVVVGTAVGWLGTHDNVTAAWIVIGRALFVGLVAMIAFGVMEQWPSRLPRWLARWGLQLMAVAVSVPLAAIAAYWLTTGFNFGFFQREMAVNGLLFLSFTGLIFTPWVALGSIVRQRELFAHKQALAFELERSQLERQALDARMRLLQAQVQPHFLFNTLANVQALVDGGSPQASKVLGTLIAYLRAAVPRLNEPVTTFREELDLVRAYLELMHMRMPDRLQFALRLSNEALGMQVPPLTLLTLVENAVRHGIDPSEEGGRIEVDVAVRDGRVYVCVSDSGVGIRQGGQSLGTGLATLRERLGMVFGGDAALRLNEVQPHGVAVELEFPARSKN